LKNLEQTTIITKEKKENEKRKRIWKY